MKNNKISKKTIILSLIILITVVSIGIFYLLFIKEDYEDLWYSGNWSYRKTIFLEIPIDLHDVEKDILIEVDTAKLISEGKLENDCRDLRFVDENNSSTLKYWIEGGCNTPNTQIWTRLRIPKSSRKLLYMYYGNELASDGQEEWNGEFITMSLDECKDNWVLENDFQGKFPLGSSIYGTTGGAQSHSHKLFDTIQDNDCTETVRVGNVKTDEECDISNDNILNNFTSSFTNIPQHTNVNFCTSKNGYLTDTSIVITDRNTPDGWKHISELDDEFPRGNDEEELQVSDSHTHSTTCVNSDLFSISGTEKYLTLNDSISTIPILREPSYYTVNFISNSNDSPIPSGAILMVTEIPPLGWDNYTDIENRFIKGSKENFKEIGGTDAHFHTSIIDYSIKSTTSKKLSAINTEEKCFPLSEESEIELLQAQNLPPYITVIFAKKKSISITKIETESTEDSKNEQRVAENDSIDEIEITFDEEKSKEEIQKEDGEVLGAATPTTPTSLLTEGQTNPTNVSDPTPEFSAIYNDPDSEDTSSYNEIEVNTSSDFTGTVMWDSGKSAMTTTDEGDRSPDISYAGSTLSESTTYYWRIKFWDSDDNESPWSATANFSLLTTPTATLLLTCGNSDPTFITETLTFSAIYTDPGSTDATDYEIEVNTLSNFTGTVMWDSGKLTTSITSGQRSGDYTYAGTSLTHEGTVYYIRLRFWDGNDVVSDWITGQFTDILMGFQLDGLIIDGIRLD